MKTIMAAAALALTATIGGSMVAAQQDAGANARSGALDRRDYDVGSFETIVAVGPHHFVVSVGSAVSVRAEGPAESLDKYEVAVEDDALEIRPKRNNRRDWDWEEFQVEPATYYVTLPRLEAAVLAGSGDMRVDRIDGEAFSASLAGSGLLDIAAISVVDARLSVAGSGTLKAAGNVRSAHISIAGSGNLDAPRMSSDTAEVSIAGSGNASLTVDEDAHVSIVGSGNVEIAGDARCTVSGFGSGGARCGSGVLDNRRKWGEWSAWDGPPPPWSGWADWGRWDD